MTTKTAGANPHKQEKGHSSGHLPVLKRIPDEAAAVKYWKIALQANALECQSVGL